LGGGGAETPVDSNVPITNVGSKTAGGSHKSSLPRKEHGTYTPRVIKEITGDKEILEAAKNTEEKTGEDRRSVDERMLRATSNVLDRCETMDDETSERLAFFEDHERGGARRSFEERMLYATSNVSDRYVNMEDDISERLDFSEDNDGISERLAISGV